MFRLAIEFATTSNRYSFLCFARLRAETFDLSNDVHAVGDFAENDLKDTCQQAISSIEQVRLLLDVRTCLSLSQGVATVVTKNCEPEVDNRLCSYRMLHDVHLPLVFLPAFAMESKPSLVCFN
jgi:hypothetical protein